MNITSHNVMNGLRKWVMEDDWNTIRLHLSHNDLDGYSCHIMTRLATNMLNPNSKSSTTFWTTPAGRENIEKTIGRFIERMEKLPKDPKKRYEKGKKKLFILLTDLGSFNPEFINGLIKDGHLVNYICVDHHVVADDVNLIELEGNTEEFQMAKNCYYVDDSMCATKAIGDAMRAIIAQKRTQNMVSPKVYENTRDMLNRVEQFTIQVDKFDRGLWGKWVGLAPDKIDGAVAEQLFFKSYDTKEKYRYVSIMANYFHTFILGKNAPADQQPFWMVDMQRFNSHRFNAIRYQLKELNTEYEKCKSLLRPKTIDFVIPEDFPDRDKLNIYEIYLDEKDRAHSFTLSSREILEEHPEIDILILVYTYRGTVDMRTNRDDLNLFEIAYANGGGGHPKAAGFPMKAKKKAEE